MNTVPGVRERLQQLCDLVVLRLSIVDADVVFQVSSGTDEYSALLTVPAHEMGIPSSPDFEPVGGIRFNEPGFKLPPFLTASLKSLLSNPDNPASALWIRLSNPIGLLAAVPWERLLQPALNIPVLRLPHHLIRPRSPRDELDVVICLCSPSATHEFELEFLDQFAESIKTGLGKPLNVHLFAEPSLYRQLLNFKEHYGEHCRINVYDYGRPARKTRIYPGHENPWFTWIRESLGPQSADVVHFLSHSHRIREEGYLALAELTHSNQDSKLTESISPQELAEFLNRCGAWSLALSSPASNGSPTGMRMLQDSMARLRPGPVLLHDMRQADSGPALAAAYRFLYQPDEPPPRSSAISLYCHPVCAVEEAVDEQRESLVNRYTLAGNFGAPFDSAEQPMWLASAQRKLEASAGDIAAEVETNPSSGRARARLFVLESLARTFNERGTDSGYS